jgi:hypothetical protein
LARGGVLWWRRRSDCCAVAEEKQLRDKGMEDGGRRRAGQRGAGCSFSFLFLAGMNPTFNPTLYNPTKNGGYFWDFRGSFFATIEVGLGLVGLGVGLGVILWSFLVILPPLLP